MSMSLAVRWPRLAAGRGAKQGRRRAGPASAGFIRARSSGSRRVGRVPGAMQHRWALGVACVVLAISALTATASIAAAPPESGDPGAALAGDPDAGTPGDPDAATGSDPDAGAVRRGPTPGVAKAAAAATGPGCDASLPVLAHHPG